MRHLAIFLFLAGWSFNAFANQVCIEKSTGNLIEYQSDATPGTCTKNAIAAGYAPDNILEQEVSLAQWQTIYKEKVLQPMLDEQAQESVILQQKGDAVRQKLGLTKQEFQDLKDALRE